MADFQLAAPFRPTGDQPQAIEKLVAGIRAGRRHQVLLGATGTGKSLEGDEPMLIGLEHPGGDISWSVEPIGSVVDAELRAGEPQPGPDGTLYVGAGRRRPRR